MARRIIQIAAVPAGSTNDETLYALADDGSAWFLVLTRLSDRYWIRLPELPQDDDRPSDQTGKDKNEPPIP